MKRNIELKARFPDLDVGHQTARRMGAQLHATEQQRDTYFRVVNGRLKLRERWLFDSSGVRQQSCPGQLIWYQRPDDARARASDYSLIVVENGPELRDVLAGSLGVTVEVEKRRVIYLHDNVRIHLDDVKGLGRFLEFEAIVNDSCDDGQAQTKLERLRRDFKISDDAILSQSYSDLTIAGDPP